MTTARTREEWRPENPKRFAAEHIVTDIDLKHVPEQYVKGRLLRMVFDPDSEFVQSLIDGEMGDGSPAEGLRRLRRLLNR